MLGEGLTTGAAAQFLTYDESAVDRPRCARRRMVLGVLALIVGVVAAVLAA